MTVKEVLDDMMDSNTDLYGKILDTDGLSYYFAKLVKLAQDGEKYRRMASEINELIKPDLGGQG